MRFFNLGVDGKELTQKQIFFRYTWFRAVLEDEQYWDEVAEAING